MIGGLSRDPHFETSSCNHVVENHKESSHLKLVVLRPHNASKLEKKCQAVRARPPTRHRGAVPPERRAATLYNEFGEVNREPLCVELIALPSYSD